MKVQSASTTPPNKPLSPSVIELFHLFRYVDEAAFRFNNRLPMSDGARFGYLVRKIVGKRLTYAELTGKVNRTTSPVWVRVGAFTLIATLIAFGRAEAQIPGSSGQFLYNSDGAMAATSGVTTPEPGFEFVQHRAHRLRVQESYIQWHGSIRLAA